jgi:hypothetical protein
MVVPTGKHIMGVLPNYSTVEPGQAYVPITSREAWKLTAEGVFDVTVYPFTAFTAGVAQAQHQEASWGYSFGAYAKRYAMSFADNTIGNFMVGAVVPSALHQDPRYFVLGHGNVFHRLGYAVSRSFITRGSKGQTEFNLSELAGNWLGAELANVYHPAEDTSQSATLTRAEFQVLWDTTTNVIKEFWPDFNRLLHHRKKPAATAPGGGGGGF